MNAVSDQELHLRTIIERLERDNAALRERLEILSKSNEKQTEEYICVDREHGLWKARHRRRTKGEAVSLSDRIRPNCEAAPWVVEEAKKLERDNAVLRSAAVEVCALARVWVTVWGDRFSDESLLRFAELELQVLRRAQP